MAHRETGDDCSATDPTVASERRDEGADHGALDETVAPDTERDAGSVASLVTLPATGVTGPGSSFRPEGEAGRYVLLEQIGAGGLGVVYRAYDPELGRRVAVKVVRAARQSTTRMLREARALARLAHPNVIHVYDVGLCDRGVFIAMEYGDGVTLRHWLGVKERSVEEILSVFCEAGRGLIAAHRAGLVHRDFKPDNVIVGDDGRTRVLDFGLACAAADERYPTPQSEGSVITGESADPLDERLTRTGVLLGTPRYMAPEQHLQGRIDERTDQFSFCVALFEALHGQPPFEGGSLAELAASVTQGRRDLDAAQRPLPKRVEHALDRGLSLEPADRYPSMQELLRDLDPAPRRTSRRLALAGALLAVVAAAAIAWAGLRSGSPNLVCKGAGDQLARVWNPDQRSRVEAAFRATGQPVAAATFERVASTIDDYASSWKAMHVESCTATRVHGHQSETVMDLRTQCLDRRLSELGALIELFGRADQQVVAHAVDAAYALPPLAACADVASLQGIAALPADPETRSRIAGLRQSLASVAALQAAGKYTAALTAARPILASARELDYTPLTAESLYQVGYLEEKGGDFAGAETLLDQAIVVSAKAGDSSTEARSWAELLWVVGYGQGKVEEALKLRPAVDAALVRTTDVLAHAWVNNNLGAIYYRRGDLEQAERYHEESLKLKRAGLPPGHPDIGKSLSNLGFLASNRGDYAKAVRYFQEAAEIVEKAYGPEHGDMGLIHNGLGTVANAQGRFEDARVHCEQALAVDRARLGEDNPDLAYDLACVGVALVGLKEWDAAAAVLEQALALLAEVAAPDTELLGTVRAALDRARARGAAPR